MAGKSTIDYRLLFSIAMLVYQRVFVGKLEKSPHHENQALQQRDILRDSECMGFGHFGS